MASPSRRATLGGISESDSDPTERSLVRRFTGGTQKKRAVYQTRSVAIAALYDDHVDEVYRYVYRRCQDDELSKDITQETFVRVVRGSVDVETVTLGWLLTVARNRLFDVLRRQRSYDARIRLIVVGDPADEPKDITDRLRVEKALQSLAINHRVVLTLHYLDGYTVPAMAEHLGRSPKAVEALVTRARRALRAELSSTGGLRDDG